MPARPEMWTLARLTVSVVAARMELGYEEISDLRLAIDELCTMCAAGSTDESRLTLTCTSGERGVRVDCVVSPVGPPDLVPAEEQVAGLLPAQLSERILAALVDDHGVAGDDGCRRGWLWKLRPSP